MPPLDKSGSEPLYRQLYKQIAESIEGGLYPAGKKLPSIRAHARELGVSSTTVEAAYLKLSSEGYIAARKGSGYTVCNMGCIHASSADRRSPEYQGALDELVKAASPHGDADAVRYDFAHGAADQAIFPFTTWARISRSVFFGEGSEGACRRNDPQGLPALRRQIARYVGEEHGIACLPEQVLVMPTVHNLIDAVSELLPPHPARIAMEEPCCDEIHRALNGLGFDVSPLPPISDSSWEQTLAELKGAVAFLTTPTCRLPESNPMPLEHRERLVEWARDANAYLIDCEYGWDLQAGIACPPPLAALDRTGNVITIGSFSDCFTPALCLGYAILPPQLMLRWLDGYRISHPQVPWQTQAAMAQFMADGHWRAHIRKVRTLMERKRHRLLKSVEEHMGAKVETASAPNSLYALMRTRDGRTGEELVSQALSEGVRVYSADKHWHHGEPDDWRYVIVGYSGIDESDIDPGIKALAHAWKVSG